MYSKSISCCAVLAVLALSSAVIQGAPLRHTRANSLRHVSTSSSNSHPSNANETSSAEYVIWSWSDDEGDKNYEIGISWPCDPNANHYQVCFDTKEQDCEGGDEFSVHTSRCVQVSNSTCAYNTGDSQSTFGCKIAYSNVVVTAFMQGNTSSTFVASQVDSLPGLQKQCTKNPDDENAQYIDVNSLKAGEFITVDEPELVPITATWVEIDNSDKISAIEVCFYTNLQPWAPGYMGSTQQSITCTIVPPTSTNATAIVNVTQGALSVNALVRPLPSCLLDALSSAPNGWQSGPSAYPRQLYTEMAYQNFSNPEVYNCTAANTDGTLIGAACGSENTLRVVHEPEWTPCLPSTEGVPLQHSTTGLCVSVSGSKNSEPVLAECDGSEEQQWVGYECDKPPSAQYATMNLRNVASDLCLFSTEEGGMTMGKCNNAQSGSSGVFQLTLAPASGTYQP